MRYRGTTIFASLINKEQRPHDYRAWGAVSLLMLTFHGEILGMVAGPLPHMVTSMQYAERCKLLPRSSDKRAFGHRIELASRYSFIRFSDTRQRSVHMTSAI